MFIVVNVMGEVFFSFVSYKQWLKKAMQFAALCTSYVGRCNIQVYVCSLNQSRAFVCFPRFPFPRSRGFDNRLVLLELGLEF